MKDNLPVDEHSRVKIFFKITLLGFFLVSSAGIFLMIINNVLKALR